MKTSDLFEVQHSFTNAQLRQIEKLLGHDAQLRDVRRNVRSYSAAVMMDGKRQTIEFSCDIVDGKIEHFKLLG